MALVCAISGEVPEEPVVSPKSGAIFEKRLIMKHLQDNETDPTNNEPLTAEELVAVQAPRTVRPRPPSATSIPALLKMFQDEWDSVMLETYKMKKHVEAVRQELTHALYQHDAACRVIARLTKERNQARQALAMLKPDGVSQPAAEQQTGQHQQQQQQQQQAAEASMEGVEETGDNALPANVLSDIEATAAKLSQGRRKRAKPEGLASVDNIKAFAEAKTHKGFHTSRSTVSSLDVHPSNDGRILTAASDKNAVVFDTSKEEVVAKFTKHSKKVTQAVFHPTADIALSSSTDQTVRVWDVNSAEEKTVIKTHNKSVVGISVHATGNYVLSGSTDNTWALSDIAEGTTIITGDDDVTGAFTCLSWHPDGMLFGIGNEASSVRIWDIKSQSALATFEGHSGNITSLCFSENGYYLATAAKDKTVKLWDLRKLANIDTLEFDHDIHSVKFDPSGTYLAVGGDDVRVYTAKQREHLTTLTGIEKHCVALGWNANSTQLLSAGSDNVVRVFAS